MYCSNCGTKNDSGSKFCIQCGSAISIPVGENRRFAGIDTRNDVDADRKKMKEPSYLRRYMKSLSLPENFRKENINGDLLQRNAASAVATVMIGLVLSLGLWFFLGFIQEDGGIVRHLGEILNLNFISIFLLSLGSPIVFANDASTTTLNGSYLILIVIPMISLFIAQRRKFMDNKSTKENLLDFMATSLIVTVIVKILALISSAETEFSGTEIALHNMGSIFSVFFIVLLIQITLSMIEEKDNLLEIFDNQTLPDFSKRVAIFLKSMGIGIGICTVGLTIAVYRTVEGFHFLIFTTIPNIFTNLWLWSMGTGILLRDTSDTTHSIFGKFNDIGDATLENGWAMYILLAGLLIIVALSVYRAVGNLLKEDYFLKVGQIATGIALVNVLVAFFGNFHIVDEGQSFLYGFSYMSVILTSFVWVFGITTLIYLFDKNEAVEKVIGWINSAGMNAVMISAFVFFAFTLWIYEQTLFYFAGDLFKGTLTLLWDIGIRGFTL